jgi:hypothetical protein
VAFLTENEVLKHLANVRYDRRVKRIVLAVKLRFAFHAPQFDVCYLLTHYQYFTIQTKGNLGDTEKLSVRFLRFIVRGTAFWSTHITQNTCAA